MPPGPSKSSRRYLRRSSTLHQTQNFKGARSVTLRDHTNFSSVRGDQNIYVTTEEKKKKFITGTEEEEAEYAEFREVKRGDIVAVRTVHRGAIERYDKKQRRWVECGEQTVVTGEVMVEGAAVKCTVVSYSGEGAEEQWKSDFRRLGGARHAENAQLVAINRSSIPMYVILGDLVPIKHLCVQAGMIGRHYLSALALHMGRWNNIWLDTSRGVFCRGPEGPELGVIDWEVEDLPLDAELLQEDVMIRYLVSRKLDRQALKALSFSYRPVSSLWHHEPPQIQVDRPTLTSTRTNTILAVGRGVWETDEWSCLGERTELPDGATRFALRSNENRYYSWLDQYRLRLYSDDEGPWAAQATSVFHAHGVPLEGNLHKYKLIFPELTGTLSHSKAKRRRRKRHPPVYLFIPPFSTSTFWSFDPSGQNPIWNNRCRYFGLPVRLQLSCPEYSWEASTYQRLRDYQVARGFDPTTTDFARHLGLPILEIVEQPLPSRFKELDDSEPIETSPLVTQQDKARAESFLEPVDFSLGILFGDTQPLDEPLPLDLSGISTDNSMVTTPVEITTNEGQGIGNMSARMNIWSSLLPTFSWAAMEDSDIHSAGF